MKTLPPLGNHMFLNEDMMSYVKHVNLTHTKCLSFAKRLNELSHRALFNVKVEKSVLKHVLLAALLQRAMKSFQASVILFERGLPEEGQVSLRTLLEITFKTVAIAKNKDVAEAFLNEDIVNRKKFINKYNSLSSVAQDSKAQLDAVLLEVKEQIIRTDAQELKTQWFAEKAGLLDLYKSAYSVLSSTVHVNIRTLENVLEVDSEGMLSSMKYGYSDEGINENLLTASECLLLTLKAAFSLGDIPEIDVNDINTMHEEFNEIFKEIFKEIN